MTRLLSTDCNITENEEKYKGITHQFDVWHLCKNFVKKLVQVCVDYMVLIMM